MVVLGLDPSLTNYGWAFHDTSHPAGSAARCHSRGRFQTPAGMEFVKRNRSQRESLRGLIRNLRPDKVGVEFPVFGQNYSEGMYGLFLFTCDALEEEGCDVVFWSPGQIKAHARDTVERPKGWVMDKPDMCEAAQVDAGGSRWNHNEADAYLCARLSARFWQLYVDEIDKEALTKTEDRLFRDVQTYVRGKKAGKTEMRGMLHRESDRFFLWSKPKD